MARRAASLQADIGAAGDTAGFLNEAEEGDLANQRGFLQSLFTGQLDFDRQRRLQREQQKQQSRGGAGALLGGLAGRAAGAFLPF